MIWPLIARNPAAASATSKRANTTSMAGLPAILARVRASRKVQIVLASGAVSASPRPRKRMKTAPFLDSTGPAKAAAPFCSSYTFVHHTRGDSNFALSTIFRDGIFGDIPLASQP